MIIQACVWYLTYDPGDSSVGPNYLGHLLRTPAEAVVNKIYHWHIYMYTNCMGTDYRQQAADGNFKMKTCKQFPLSLMQHLPN